MVNFNGTLIIQIINFFILLFILNTFLFKPVIKNIITRREYIKNMEKQIEATTAKLEQLQEEYTRRIGSAQKESHLWFENQLKISNEKKQDFLLGVKQEVISYVKEEKANLMQEKEKLKFELEKDLNGISEKIMNKVIDYRVS